MHLDDESIERFLHGELDPGPEATVQSHLASCPSCEARLEASRALEARLFGLLGTLDHQAPQIDWNTVVRHPPIARLRAHSRIAASVAFLLLAGGILYALPGSPVPGWIDRLRGRVATETPPPGIGSRSEIETAVSGLSVRPAGPFVIVFEDSQTTGAIKLRLVPTPDVEIRVLGSPVQLESGPDRVTISNAISQSSYEILVPESVSTIRVRVEGEEVFLAHRGEVQSAGLPDSTGFYVLDLGSSDR